MTNQKLDLRKTSFALFFLFLFFLPLYEAPKNIFSVLFVCIGSCVVVSNASILGAFSSKYINRWAFFLVAISSFFAGLDSPYMDVSQRFYSALNWALMPLVVVVFLMLKPSPAIVDWAMRLCCVSVVVAIFQAFFTWSGTFPELNSVGHVNQSALYAAFCLIPVGLLIVRRSLQVDIPLAILAIFSIFWYQSEALSLVGLSVSIAICAGMFFIYCLNRGHIRLMIGLIFLCFGLTVSVLMVPPQYFGPYKEVKQEFDDRVHSKIDPFSQRDRLLNSAWVVAGQSMVGFGLGSFGEATDLARIKVLIEAKGRDWASEGSSFYSSSHGHNLFANVIVERGWVGVISIGAFLLALLWSFKKNLDFEDAHIGILVLVVTILAGMGQSVLHLEHGQLIFLCLGFSSRSG